MANQAENSVDAECSLAKLAKPRIHSSESPLTGFEPRAFSRIVGTVARARAYWDSWGNFSDQTDNSPGMGLVDTLPYGSL